MNAVVDDVPGRTCPVEYHYGAASLNRPPDFEAQTLYAVGGLYGNLPALRQVEALQACESQPAQLVFNGDFHWFDAEPRWFANIDAGVKRHRALRGNVETEIASDNSVVGCGCAYPIEVDDGVVERSNRIASALRAAALKCRDASWMLKSLQQLPMNLVAQVGPHRVALVHGDADTLAGWQFDVSSLHSADADATLRHLFDRAGVDVFASTHTCLPGLRHVQGRGVVINNGTAGMPNFAGTHYALVSRISVHPPGPDLPVLYGGCFDLPGGALHVHAVRVDYDVQAWRRLFLSVWPEGSDANLSYWPRIERGAAFSVAQALGHQTMKGVQDCTLAA